MRINKDLFTDLCWNGRSEQAPRSIGDLIRYVDDHLVVIDKPAGMPTHSGQGCEEAANLLAAVRDYVGAWVYLPHRLDRATSGLVIVARSQNVAKVLNEAFACRLIEKTYEAVVRGWLTTQSTITRPLARIDGKGEQSAISVVKPIAHFDALWPVRPFDTSRYSLVELTPLTGRRHQLRRHLAGLSHPIVGDTKYGDGAHNKAFRQHLAIHRLMLHAVGLRFRHPVHGGDMDLRSAQSLLHQSILSQDRCSPCLK